MGSKQGNSGPSTQSKYILMSFNFSFLAWFDRSENSGVNWVEEEPVFG